MPAEIVVCGHICLDLLPQFAADAARLEEALVPGKLVKVGPALLATGGVVSNTGLALHRLGLPVRLLGKVGDDLFGRALLALLRHHHPALAEGMIIAPDAPTSYTVVISPPGVDRIFLHCPGANDTFSAADVPYAQLAGARLLHFGYPPLMRRIYLEDGAELETLFRRAKQQNAITSLDMARPDPASEAGRVRWHKLLRRVLPHVDLFLPSRDEILFMLGREPGGEEVWREVAEELLSLGAAVVGLKLGEEGWYLRTTANRDRLAPLGSCVAQVAEWADRELLAPCFQVEVVGTTGSGDSSAAGFLAGLVQGLSPEEAITAAVAVGACSVEAADATSGIRPWAEVQARVRAGWERRAVTRPLPGWRWEEAAAVWRGPRDRRNGC